MTKINFYFGVGKTRRNTEIPTTAANVAIREICLRAADTFGGYTLYTTVGGWVDGDGVLVTEPGRNLEVITGDDLCESAARPIVDFIKTALEQSSVLVIVNRNVNASYL